MSDPVLVELARRGDLTVVRSTTGRVGLRRDSYKVPALLLDAAEWRWLSTCAVPVALRELAARETEGAS